MDDLNTLDLGDQIQFAFQQIGIQPTPELVALMHRVVHIAERHLAPKGYKEGFEDGYRSCYNLMEQAYEATKH